MEYTYEKLVNITFKIVHVVVIKFCVSRNIITKLTSGTWKLPQDGVDSLNIPYAVASTTHYSLLQGFYSFNYMKQ